MKLDLSALARVLDEQKRLVGELLELAGDQMQALKQDRFDQLVAITGHQEYIGRQLAGLEQKRQSIMDQYSQKIGADIKNITELLLYANHLDQESIQKTRDEIVTMCKRLSSDNELNASLTRQSLTYTAKVLGVLNRKNSFVYGKLGAVQRKSPKGIIDTIA